MLPNDLKGLLDQAQDRRDEWAQVLSQWYERQWESALDGSEAPDSGSILGELDPQWRPVAEEVFSRIDASYRSRWNSRHAGQTPRPSADEDGPTVISATPDRSRRHSPSQSLSGLGETVVFSTEPTATPGAGPADPQVGAPPSSEIDAPTVTLDSRRTARATAVSRPRKSSSEPLPERIGNYVIERELGRGGMGVVYLARQGGIDRQVALKMILMGARASDSTHQRFLAEARTIGKFQHEHIVRVYEVGVHEGLPYVSLEFVDGPTLSDCLRQETLPPREAARILRQVAVGVEYAHTRGVIHRDLKPANILMTNTGTAKITDFGLAKELDTDSELSRAGTIVGTPSYMAPEQANASRDVGPAADVYGLGAMLYCMLVGRPPFVGENTTETVMQVLRDEPLAPRKIKANLPLDLETICLKCLQKERGRRYESAGAVAEDLDRYLRGEPIVARPISRAERLWRWCRRNPRAAIPTAAAACLALCLAIGGPVVSAVIYSQQQQTLVAKKAAEENAKTARAAADEAERNAKLAVAAQDVAEQKKGEAEESAKLAQTQNKVALDTLRQVTFAIDRELKDRPRLQGLRKSLISEVTQGMERTKQLGFDPRAQHMIAAGTYANLGRLNLDIGRAEAAMADFGRCLEVFDHLEKTDQLPNAYHNKSQIRMYLADAARKLGDLKAADEHLREALRVRMEWLASKPGDQELDIEQNIAATMGRLGDVAMAAGRLDDARSWYQKSLEIRERYAVAHGNDLGARQEIVGSRWSLARVAFQAEQWEPAVQTQDEVVKILRELAALNADRLSVPWNLAKALQDLGMMHLYQDDLALAETNYAEAVAKLRELASADPENYSLKEDLAAAIYGLATVRLHAERSEEAAGLYAESLELRQAAADVDPENTRRQIQLALSLARVGKTADAEKIADPLREAESSDARTQYDLAGVYAQIAAATARVSDADPEQVKRYLQRAEELVKAAKAGGYARLSDLERDPDLLPLRRGA